MSKKTVAVLALIGMSAALLVPVEALAQTSDFGGQAFREHSDKIQAFLFGSVMRYVGVLGIAYGFAQAFFGAIRQCFVYVGVGLGVNVVPIFLDGVFSVSGMLLQ